MRTFFVGIPCAKRSEGTLLKELGMFVEEKFLNNKMTGFFKLVLQPIKVYSE